MTKLKYSISTLLILSAFFLMSEIYVWHVDSFDSEYMGFTMYAQEGIKDSEMKDDIVEEAFKTGIDIFTVERKNKSIYEEKITIYCTKEAAEILEKESYLKAGNFTSLIFGKVSLKFCSIEEIPCMKDFYEYKAIGDSEKIFEFKNHLQDKYAGSIPKEGQISYNIKAYAFGIWTCVFLTILLCNIYEANLKRKETAIKIILGLDIKKQLAWKILSYGIFLGLIYIAGRHLFNAFETGLCDTLFIKCSIIILFSEFFVINYETKALPGLKNRKRTYIAGYIFKSASMALLVLTMCTFIELVSSGIEYLSLNEYFEENREYSFVSINLSGMEYEKEDLERIEKYEREIASAKIGCFRVLTGYFGANKDWVIADIASLKGRERKIFKSENTVYIPEKLYSKEERKRAEEYFLTMTGEKPEIRKYSENIKFFCIDNEKEFPEGKKVKNPVVVVFDGNVRGELYSYYTSVMFDIDENEWNDYIEDKKEYICKSTTCLTNVYKLYEERKTEKTRKLLTGLFAVIAVVIISLSISEVVIGYEFKCNGKEIILKRIHGIMFFSRYKRIVLADVFSWTISVVIVSIYTESLNMTHITAGILILVTDIILMAYKAAVLEKASMQKVTAGESI